MSLLPCTECEKEISDQAEACPNCGAPTGAKKAATSKKKTHPITWIVLGLVLAAGVWFINSPAYEKQFLPKMPVDVQFRPSLIGKGLVLIVANKADKNIAAAIKLSRPTNDDQSTFNLNLTPGASESVGHLEGWVLQKGDLIKIENEEYQTWAGSIP